MSRPTVSMLLIAVIGLAPPRLTAQQAGNAGRGVDALAPIVGVWQSDTTNGTSAMSNCVWTPEHGAVLCEQRITTPNGPLTALNLFTYKPATGKYELYVLSRPGDPMYHVQISIDGPIWTYGGDTAGADGRFSRTINDFTGADSYAWRQESKAAGASWQVVTGGRSRRMR